MLGFAVIDNQSNEDRVAVWVVAHVEPQRADNVNAVTVDRHGDPDAMAKVRSLTRSKVIVLTAGSSVDTLPVTGEASTVDDLEDLVRETEARQHRIVEAVESYARRTRSKTLVPPVFAPSPKLADFVPEPETATRRAFPDRELPRPCMDLVAGHRRAASPTRRPYPDR